MPSRFEPYLTDLNLSLAALLLSAVIGIVSFHRHFTPGRGFRYRRINWMVVCLFCVSVAFVLVVHIVNIAGFETGRR